ncbi:MAG: protease modulator HflC [Steroidobacteraceae bacterium]
MSGRVLPIVIAAAIVVLAALTSLFTVDQGDVALRTQFGAIVGPTYSPGLHWKLPWDQVVRLDRRVLTQTNPIQTVLTSDNHKLNLNSYVEWRIADPVRYYEATGGDEKSAEDRLAEIVTSRIESVVAHRSLSDIVVAQRAGVTHATLASARAAAAPLGIRLIDARVESITLPDSATNRVYDKMKQDFAATANRLRAQGESAATTLRATADRERTEIIANARRQALVIKGQADADAADTYARAYSADPEFYAFYRSMQAYEHSLGKSNGVLVLSPDSEFFKYMKDPGTARR